MVSQLISDRAGIIHGAVESKVPTLSWFISRSSPKQLVLRGREPVFIVQFEQLVL